LAVLGEEFGEVGEAYANLSKAILGACYQQEIDDRDFFEQLAQVEIEAIQMGAMALRFILSLGRYNFQIGRQHSQNGGDHA
jgi:hypothetical protein